MSQKSEKLMINKDFVSDIYKKDMIYGLTIRSDIHKGKIDSIFIPNLEEGYNVVSHKDIPGKNKIEVFGNEMPFLAETEIEYLGQPVLLISGPNKHKLNEIKEQIKIKYINEKPVFDYKETGENKLLTFVRGDSYNEINIAHKVIESEYYTPAQEHYYLETQGAYTEIDKGIMLVYSSTGYPFHVRDSVSDFIGLSKNKVRVFALENAGSCNEKIIFPSLLAGHCSLLTYLSKKPVKMVYSREEDHAFTPRRHPVVMKYKTAINNKGRITGMIVHIKLDSGAYSLISPLVLERIVIASTGAYSCENVSIIAYIYKTNKIPSAYYSGLGEPQAFLALELHSLQIARASNADPYIWKTNNLSHKFLPNGQKIKNLKTPEILLDNVVKRSDFVRKYGAYESNRKNRENIFSSSTLKRGIGIALCFHGIGITGKFSDSINPAIKLVLDTNNKLRIFTSIVNRDECIILKHIAGSILNISISNIIIEKCDTFFVPDSGPPICSHSISTIGKLIIQCCNTIKIRRKKEKLPIEIRRMLKPKLNPERSDNELNMSLYSEFAWEATVVEVEIDSVMLKPKIIGIWTSIFAGDEIVTGQYRKKIDRDLIKNLEFVILKQTVSEDSENYLSSLLSVKELIPSEISLIKNLSKASFPKLIGLGDQAITGLAPAYIGAVSQAIGCEINKIPIYPEIIDLILKKEKTDED